MSDNAKTLCMSFLVALNIGLVIANAVSYSGSSLLSRVVIISSYVVLLISIGSYSLSKNSSSGTKFLFAEFFLSSLFFLTWRSAFFAPKFMMNSVNSEAVTFSNHYADTGNLVFDLPHSYFFLRPLTLYFLCSIGGFTVDVGIWLSLLMYGILVALVSILVLKALQHQLQAAEEKSNLVNVMITLVGFSLISFAYSERSGNATNFQLLLAFMLLFFLFSRKLRNRGEIAVSLLLVVGITFGDANGIMLLVTFLLFSSIFGNRKTILFLALIPIAYLIFSANSYTISLARYSGHALTGFAEFSQAVFLGRLPERVIPWQRLTLRTELDTYITSTAYISLFALSFIVALILMFSLIKERKKADTGEEEFGFGRASLIWLIFWLGVAVVAYIGYSVGAETVSSDVRTISVVLLSIVVPFIFMSTNLVRYIVHTRTSLRKILLSCLILVMMVASLRTVYEVNPKSFNDPIYAVEDDRVGLASVYAIAAFVNNYYPSGGVWADYKVLIHIYKYLPSPEYEPRYFREKALGKNFELFPADRGILVFTIAGTTYPSLYHYPGDYLAAYNFSMSHDRILDNGALIVVSLQKTAE